MGPCVVWEFLSPPIGEPDYRNIIIDKPCVVGARRTDIMQIYSVTITTGIPPIWLSYFTLEIQAIYFK